MSIEEPRTRSAPRALRRLLAVAAVTMGALGAVTATVAQAAPSRTSTTEATVTSTAVESDSLRRAVLRITITTSSDWAQLDMPGASAGHVVRSNRGNRGVQPTERGVVVHGTAGRSSSVTVDVVTELRRSTTTGLITVRQGAAGSTQATVENRTTKPFTVATVNGVPDGSRSVQVSADALMGGVQLPWTRADDERLVLAFTYPWFGDWARDSPALSVHPTSPWRSWRDDDAMAMATLARDHGIDGFVMSFSGAQRDGLALYQTLAAGARTGGRATILLETAAAGSADVVEQWLREALSQASSPAFLRVDDVPVVFAFESGRVPLASWKAITDRLAAAGTPVRVIGDSWDGGAGIMAGQYRYNALFEAPNELMTTDRLTDWNQRVARGLRARATLGVGDPGLVVATVQPGWDDRLLRGADRVAVDRDGTATYDETWRAGIAGEPDWVVVTSWNEWFEGTGIAPSLEFGHTALEATRRSAQRFDEVLGGF